MSITLCPFRCCCLQLTLDLFASSGPAWIQLLCTITPDSCAGGVHLHALADSSFSLQCDEQTPACQRCVKRGEKCSFLTSLAEQDSPNSRSNGTPHDCTQDQHARQILELELMHHWTTSTYQTISYDSPRSIPLLTIELPRSALTHDYLLDGIFSFTALHMAYESQADPPTAEYYVSAAISFRDRGMQRVAPSMQDFYHSGAEPDAREVFAMFWFSVLAGMVTMALTVVTRRDPANFGSQEPPNPSGTAFISMQVEIAQLWRGTRTIMEIATHLGNDVHLYTDPAGLNNETDGKRPANEFEPRMAELEAIITNAAEDVDKTLYRESLALMRKASQTWIAKGTIDDIMAWGPQLGNEFACLLKGGAPLALLSALCYGTLLGQITHKWWAEGAGKTLVDECSIALAGCPEEWQSLIQWARAKVDLLLIEPTQADVSAHSTPAAGPGLVMKPGPGEPSAG